MPYQSADLDKWLGTLFSDTNTQKFEDPLTHNDLASRYGLGQNSTSTPRYDDFANDLISAAQRNGANLSHDRWTQQGLQGALRYASPLASVDAARGYNMMNTNPNAAGEPLYDTSLFGTNGKGRIADFLNTGSLFNRGETGVGAATAVGSQDLPGTYRNIVQGIGDKYTAPGMERYANSSGTQFGLEALLNSIYGGGVANQIATDQLRRGYDTTGNPFTHYYDALFGGGRDFSPHPVENGQPGGQQGGGTGGTGGTDQGQHPVDPITGAVPTGQLDPNYHSPDPLAAPGRHQNPPPDTYATNPLPEGPAYTPVTYPTPNPSAYPAPGPVTPLPAAPPGAYDGMTSTPMTLGPAGPGYATGPAGSAGPPLYQPTPEEVAQMEQQGMTWDNVTRQWIPIDQTPWQESADNRDFYGGSGDSWAG